jgi:hypothetical protein
MKDRSPPTLASVAEGLEALSTRDRIAALVVVVIRCVRVPSGVSRWARRMVWMAIGAGGGVFAWLQAVSHNLLPH